KDKSHQTFYKALQTINIDQQASLEPCNFTQKLLNNKRKKFDIAAVCELWDNVAAISNVDKAVNVIKAHIKLDNFTNQCVQQLILPETMIGKRRDKIYLDNDHDEILKKAKTTNKIDVPILNVKSLEGTSTTFKVVAENETEANKKSFCSEVGMLFVDKTIYIKKLEEEGLRFRILFLRPCRFGKSAFLDMLCQYYDIKNADKFFQLFGPLYIGQHPTNSQNKCLVLKFDLSSINVHSYKMMEESFNGNVNHVL
ncbi:6037_t:CDS:2, partial [Entrophospora sp. SA101]